MIVPVFVNIFNEIAADNPTEDTSLPLMTQITGASWASSPTTGIS